ncbi:MAG: hypothetical protein PHW95_04045 [Patescibacteria group bacterium]|nr:hypothetical protein [Patescibacteria group bacterium]
MASQPIICFGQQPCGFFPKRYLIAKINSAQALQQKIGGKIIFFYHDSDHDYRETITVMRDCQTGVIDRLNFEQENKIQKKYSPLYTKRIPADWQAVTARRLPRFTDKKLITIFSSIKGKTVADFCLELYQQAGLLDNIEVVRSSDKTVRHNAIDMADDYFVDLNYENEIVRARFKDGKVLLHRGGDQYIELPKQVIEKSQINPDRKQRFSWMQSVVHCTHYITGQGEGNYLETQNFPDVIFINREEITDPDFAWVG